MKKIIALILALALCFALCACGRDSQEGMEELRSPEMTGARFSPEKTKVSGEEFKAISAEAAGDSIVCVGTLGSDPMSAEYRLYRINPADNTAAEIPGVTPGAADSFDALSDGSVLVTHTDSDGAVHFTEISPTDSVSEYVPELPEELSGKYYPDVFFTDGGYLLNDGFKLTKIDRDGLVLGTKELSGWTSLLRRADGGITGVCRQYQDEKSTVFELGQDLSFTAEYEIDGTFSELLQCSDDDELFVNISDIIYRVNYKTGEKQSYANVFSSGCVGSGAFVFLDNERFFDCTKARAPALWRPFVEGDKQTLTLGTYLSQDAKAYNYETQLKNAIDSFNETSENYFIELVDYAAYGEAGRDILLTDLSTGNTADMYDLRCLSPAIVSKGLFVDLYPLFEAEPEIDLNDFNSAVLDVLETDGKLFSLVPCYSAACWVGRRSVIGDGLSAGEFCALAEEYGESEIFDRGITRREFFEELLTSSADEYIDYHSAKCSFDSPRFRQCLEYAAKLPAELSLEIRDYPGSGAYTGSALFIRCWMETDPVMDYLYYESIFQEDMTVCDFPSSPGGGSSFTPMIELGITQSSQNQAGAWEFFKFLLSDSYQWNCYSLPMNKGIMEQLLTGRAEVLREPKISIGMYLPEGGDTAIPYLPADDTTVGAVLDIIYNIKSKGSYDAAVLDIILSELERACGGVQTLDQAAASIQSRASIYLSEQYG